MIKSNVQRCAYALLQWLLFLLVRRTFRIWARWYPQKSAASSPCNHCVNVCSKTVTYFLIRENVSQYNCARNTVGARAYKKHTVYGHGRKRPKSSFDRSIFAVAQNLKVRLFFRGWSSIPCVINYYNIIVVSTPQWIGPVRYGFERYSIDSRQTSF